jgi:hypothetical protein
MAKAEKAKAERSHKPKTTDKAQSERFIEAARELGADRDRDTLDRAIRSIASAKRD